MSNISYDYIYRPRVLSFGIDIGNNYTVNGKVGNFFIEISLLFWSFGIEYCFR